MFFVALAIQVVGELLRPKQKPTNAKPSSLDNFSIPTAEEGRPIPVFCGKVKIDGANVTWYGDLEVVPIKKKVKTGWFSSTKQTIGFKYSIGMLMFLAHAREDLEIHEIRWGDKQPKHSRTEEGNGVVRFDFADETFYGGPEKEGGVSGMLRFYRGNDLQPENAYFSARIGETAPAYRNFAYAMVEKMYVGTSPYIKPVGFILSSYPNTLGMPDNRHKIGDDANPICFIFEIVNDSVWGLNINSGRVNVAGWRAVADTCFAEGYGISMIVNGGSSAEDLIGEVLRHIDGVIYTDPTTGLLEIKVARDDYDAETLPVFGPDDMVQAIKFARTSWSQTKNTIKVTYADRSANFTEAVVSQQDLANIQQRDGEIATEEIAFLGFSSFAAADRACARALKTLSYPLAKASMTLSRTAWTLRPGSVFKLNWPARGINGVIMRVVRIDYGNIKQNRIDIEAVEDIFAISQSAYVAPPPSGWVDPVTTPLPLARSDLFELPLEFTGMDGTYVATLGSRASGIDEGYDIWSGSASGDVNLTFKNRVTDFTPSGTTTAIYPNSTAARDPVGFALANVIHGSEVEAAVSEETVLAGDSVALIRSGAGDELVAFKNFNGAQVSDVIRGVYGTVPLTHPSGAVVWFLSYGFGLENETPHVLPRTVYAKMLTYNVRGALPILSATQKSLALTGRAGKPYAVRLLRVNNVVDPVSITGDAVVTWEFVNPAIRGGRISAAGAGSDPVTPGVSFTVKIYINNTLVRTATDLSSPAYTYTVADRLADSTNTANPVKFEVSVIQNGVSSLLNTTANAPMVSAATAVTISTASPLPNAAVGGGYNTPLAATGGAGAPYTWSISGGGLPAGIAIDNANQRLTGVTSVAPGVFNVTLRADSPAGVFGTKAFTFTVV